ncbi:hypothetical protein, partial [Dokdonia pacifica]|uniref:hypothetical protein n=1 Tax=Dokdonia pacifica TaxID=1627892 RepID=UPI001E5F02FB
CLQAQKMTNKFLSKSENKKIISIFKYITETKIYDSDFWALGGGSQEVQTRLNNFTTYDWEDLKQDLLNWKEDDRNILINSVAFGFDKIFSPYLNEEMVSSAGKFLLDLFILDIGDRHEISYFAFFIMQSELNSIEDLKTMRDWLKVNGYENANWIKSEINPIGNIQKAIEKASR